MAEKNTEYIGGLVIHPEPPDGVRQVPGSYYWSDGKAYTPRTQALAFFRHMIAANDDNSDQRRPIGIDLSGFPVSISREELEGIIRIVTNGWFGADLACVDLHRFPDGSMLAWRFNRGAAHWTVYDDLTDALKSIAADFRSLGERFGPNVG